MIHDGIRARVNVRIDVSDAVTGEILRAEERHNLVTTAGLNLLRDLLKGDSSASLTHFGYGTGTTAAAAGDTALEAEVARDSITQKTANSAQLILKYYLAANTGNGNSLAEAGLLTAASSGTLYARVTHTPISKTAAVAVTYTWTLSWADDGV